MKNKPLSNSSDFKIFILVLFGILKKLVFRILRYFINAVC